MATISLEDKWIKAARVFGDVESVVREALTDRCRGMFDQGGSALQQQ